MRLSSSLRSSTAAVAAASALGAGLAGLAGFASASPAEPALPAAAVAATGPKPVVGGLLDRQGFPRAGTPEAVRSFVVEAKWSEVQPTADSFDTSSIDRQLAQARAAGMRVKLRVLAGMHSPAWVKTRAGTVTVHLTDGPSTGSAVKTPRWWRSTYKSDYDALQAKLAARYDADPAIGQVALCGPTIQYCEPYLRAAGAVRNRKAIRAAGFWLAADRAALTANLDAGRHWKSTASEVAFNPYQVVRSDHRYRQDVGFTNEQMRLFRAKLGERAVLGNHSLSSSRPRSADYASMYAEQKRLGKPIAYQTMPYQQIGDWRTTLEFAIRQGASSVELPYGYRAWPAGELGAYAKRLAANVVRRPVVDPPPTGTPTPTRMPTSSPAPTLPAPSPSPTPSPSSTPNPPATLPGDITIAAAGDLCDAGRPSSCSASADLVAALNPAKVVTLGDNQYTDGTLSEFLGSYDKSWGRFKDKTLPVVGNHEIRAGASAPGYCTYFGAAAHCPTRYYATDLGKWTLIALDSSGSSFVNSTQLAWLDRELAAARAEGDNVLAFVHHPLYSAGKYSPGISFVRPLWEKLVAYRADVVLSGHDHNYQRFAPMTSTGPAPTGQVGIREFVSGLGGSRHYAVGTSRPGLQKVIDDRTGVLLLRLAADSYSWEFRTATGGKGTVIDSGTQAVNR